MIKTLLKEVKEYKAVSVATPLLMIVEVALEMIIPLLIASLIDNGVNAGNMNHIVKMGAFMLLASLFSLLAGGAGAITAARASTGFAKNLRSALFKNVQTFSFENIDKFSTAGLVTRMTTDVTNVQNAYQMSLRMGVRAPISFVVAMIMSFYINPKLATTYLIAVAVILVLVVILLGLTKKLFEILMKKYDGLNADVQENVSAIRVVKAYVREDYEKKKFFDGTQALYAASIKAEKVLAVAMPIMMATIFSCIMVISYRGAKEIVIGQMTTGELISMLSYCMNILVSLVMFAAVIVMIVMSSASMKRISEVLSEETTIKNGENPCYEVVDGSIEFKNVSFSYKSENAEKVIKDVNLSIKSGETIGIIGSTGSSKTSLVNLISRLYDVTEGSVLVGGKDVREYDVETIRNEVSVVLQKNVLFQGTILDNLRWGDKNATLEDCKRVCKLACADEFIEAFPDGYETMIEQGGTNVSGGQRQRLCIARALLKKPKVLILDDSTSAVDTATDAKIRRAFKEEIPGTTKLIIAQRISSVQDADRIIVMNEGCVDDFGTHDELMERNEIYRDVCISQQGQGNGDFDIEEGGAL